MADDRQIALLRAAAALSLILSVVNHLLPPKAFAATQLLFDYESGLVRRGLAGEVLRWILGDSVTIGEIYAAAAAITLVGVLVAYAALIRDLGGRRGGLLFLIIGLNSFAFSSFVGSTGYLDGILLILAVAALFGSDPARPTGLVVRAGLVVLGVLVHENMLPYFAVLIGLDLVLARRGTARLGAALVPVAAGVAAVAGLAIWAELPPAEAEAYAAHIASRADFAFDTASTDVAGRTIGDNFALMAEMRGTTKYWAWVLFDGVPLAALAGWLIWLNGRLLGRADRPARMAMAAAVLAPFSLNLIAFDVVRFGVAACLTGMLATVLILRHVEGARDRLDAEMTWPHFAIMLVLVANIFTIEVNEGAGHVAQFPWVLVSHLQWLVN
jgi:hypothetical protein